MNAQPTRRPSFLRHYGLPLLLLCAALGIGLCAALGLLLLFVPEADFTVTINHYGQSETIHTTAKTVSQALAEIGINPAPTDQISPALDAAISAGETITIRATYGVTVLLDEQIINHRSLSTQPAAILSELGITLGAVDRLWIDGTSVTQADLQVWPVPAREIVIHRAVRVTIDDGGQAQVITTTSDTVADALAESGITLYLADTITPDLNAPLSNDLHIIIVRSVPLTIVADGVSLETRVQSLTVGAALQEAGVPLVGLDYAIPSESQALQAGMLIRIIRVTEEVQEEQSAIPFETVYQADSTLELDNQSLVQEGQNGVRKRLIRIRYENGIAISQQDEGEVVAVEPLNRIIAYGIAIVFRNIDTPDGPRQYWRVLRMYTTSYHPAALGGDNITATGRKLTKGVVGIDPKIIPYGSEVYVPGYGIGIAADTGGPRKFKLWIDLGYDDENWVSWSKYTDVYLLAPVPEHIQYILPG